jgi:hypothetical protein
MFLNHPDFNDADKIISALCQEKIEDNFCLAIVPVFICFY